MALKTVLEALDDVPDALRDLYQETDGKFVLALDGIDDHPGVATLKNAFERTKKDRQGGIARIKELEDKLAEYPDDFDPDEYTRLKEGGGKNKVDIEAAVNARVSTLTKKHANEVDRLKTDNDQQDKFIRRLLVDDGLTKALVEAGINQPSYLKAAKAMLASQVKVDHADGEYSAVFDTDMGPIPITKFVADWAGSDEGKSFVTPAKGGDAPGSHRQRPGEANPFGKTNWNKTDQAQLIKHDRAKAERLAKAAGFANLDAAAKAAIAPAAA